MLCLLGSYIWGCSIKGRGLVLERANVTGTLSGHCLKFWETTVLWPLGEESRVIVSLILPV